MMSSTVGEMVDSSCISCLYLHTHTHTYMMLFYIAKQKNIAKHQNIAKLAAHRITA